MTTPPPGDLLALDDAAVTAMEFEDAFAALQDVVARLDAGGLTVSQSVTLYEVGVRLARRCNERLDQAELRVRTVRDGIGTPAMDDDFDDDE